MSLVSIRPYRDTEVTAILALWRAAGLVPPPRDPDRDIRLARRDGAGDVFVAEYQERLVATIMVGREEDRGWLYYLAVEPTVQRKGLGRDMVRHAETWLRAQGIAKVMLMIRNNNRGVREFYSRLGYVAEPKQIMSRALTPARAGAAGTPSRATG